MTGKVRLVLDTNVLISRLLRPRSARVAVMAETLARAVRVEFAGSKGSAG